MSMGVASHTSCGAAASVSAAAPDITEDYESLQVIGKGSFGTVFKATRKSDRQAVVIKEVLITALNEAERRCALQEASTLSKLQHDNIIEYHETRSAEGKLFIVMEFAAGGDLSSAIKRRAQQQRYYSEDQVMQFFVQICLALWHVHAQNFMHRDLKSQNIFLCDNNVAKLGDFGIARSFKHTQDMASTAVGTPYYLSPEICEDKPYNTMSDVWGLGCILYEMATLKRAFEGNNLPALVTKILRGRFSPIPSRYSMHLRSLIHSMLARNPNRRPSVEAILNLPWMRRHLDRYAAHMQRIARSPTPHQRGTLNHSPAGAQYISMLRAQPRTTTDRTRMASASLDRATASSQQRQAQPQCKRPDGMVRHPRHPQNARGGSVSPFPASRTPPASARRPERPAWQTPTARVKHPTTDGVSLRSIKLLNRSPAVGGRAARVNSVDTRRRAEQQPCRQSTESLESHSSKVRSSRESNTSSTRWPRQPPCIGNARRQVPREQVAELRTKSQHTERSQPKIHQLSAQQAFKPAQNTVIDSRPRHSTSATIPAGTPADQQPDKDDDELSLSSLSSISSHPVLSEPTAAELGPVGSSFWVPPPVMADVPPDSPAHDSACLPPFPALFCSHVSSPQRVTCEQRARTPEPSRLQQARPKLAPLQEAAADDMWDSQGGSRHDCAADQQRKLRSAHAQARDARKAGQHNAEGQRLVSSTWLAGNFAALDEMQDNLGVPGAPCTADGVVSSRSMQRQKSTPTPRSPHTDAESLGGLESHAISPHAHQLSTLDSDTDGGGAEVRAVPSLSMLSQEPSEVCVRAGADCDMREAGPSIISPKDCARGGRSQQRMRSDDGFDDVMLPQSPTRYPAHQASKPKLSTPSCSPSKPASRPAVTVPVNRVSSLARRTQRQTPERAIPTHRRERTRPMNSQQRAAMRQKTQESQQAHRSALQRMQPRVCREELRRAAKDFAARVREVKPAEAGQPSSGPCVRNPTARNEAFVIPLTPRGQRKGAGSGGAVDFAGAESRGEENNKPQPVKRPQRRLWVAPRQDDDDSALEMSFDTKNDSASVCSGVASHSQPSRSEGGCNKPWRQNTERATSRSTTRSAREPVVEIYVPLCDLKPACGAQARDSLAEEVPEADDLAPGDFAGPSVVSPAYDHCEHTTLSSLGGDGDTVLMAESSEAGYQRYSTHSTPSEIFDSAKQDGSLQSERRAASQQGRVPDILGHVDAHYSDCSVGRSQENDATAPHECKPVVAPSTGVTTEGATAIKIDELRASLQAHLGSEKLLAAYRVVRKHQCERQFDAKAERAAQAELESLLAPDTHLAYTIHRLMTLEEMFFGK